jgi:RNA-directed DNA polymerase
VGLTLPDDCSAAWRTLQLEPVTCQDFGIHRNPVKRGSVPEPDQWAWSSFRWYAHGERGPVLVNEQRPAEMFRPYQKEFKETKLRLIDNPAEPLRGIQRQIQRKLLGSLDLPFYLCGGVKGRTLLDNVILHTGAAHLLTVDIKDFFPSIDNRKVYYVWTALLGCTPRIGALLTRLTTRLHYLPQGSSTSTTLANLVLHSVDRPIREACKKAGVRVDDLAFSGPNSLDVIPIIIGSLRASGFAVSRQKVRIMGLGTRKVLNGILLGRFPTVLPERIAQLRSGIHKLRTNQVAADSLRDYSLQLGSSIAQVASIDPAKGGRLQVEFERAQKMAS